MIIDLVTVQNEVKTFVLKQMTQNELYHMRQSSTVGGGLTQTWVWSGKAGLWQTTSIEAVNTLLRLNQSINDYSCYDASITPEARAYALELKANS